jgi:glucose/arabinose dehydrogenase
MMKKNPKGLLLALLLAVVFLNAPQGSGQDLPIDLIELPPGFEITVYARDLPGARSLALGSEVTVFVGTRSEGRVYAIRDGDGNGRIDAGEIFVIGSGLDLPNGVAFRDGSLYVAEVSRILRFDGIEARLGDPPAPIVVKGDLPEDRGHGWKFIAFGPDGKLYVPIGAPCNVCDPGDPYASIARIDPDGGNFEIFARGVRNTVGFDWHPETGDLWFTDNGRDWLGDDEPPDELNRAAVAGQHFGFPFCHAGIPDPVFGGSRGCGEFTPPEMNLGPHVAALGMRFYSGAAFPAGIPRRDLHRRARLLKPGRPHRLPGDLCEVRGRTGHRLRDLRRGVAPGKGRLGSARGRSGDARRRPPRLRRQGGSGL